LELSDDTPFQDEDKDYKKKMQMKEDLGVFVTMAVIVVLVKSVLIFEL
jgi:hypothetical protein